MPWHRLGRALRCASSDCRFEIPAGEPVYQTQAGMRFCTQCAGQRFDQVPPADLPAAARSSKPSDWTPVGAIARQPTLPGSRRAGDGVDPRVAQLPTGDRE